VTTALEIQNPKSKIQNQRAWTVLIAAAIFATSFFLSSFRLPQAIDLQADEATYAIESIAFQRTGMTRWNGTPFFVHPPLFFAIEAVYFKALGIGEGPLYERLVNKPYLIGEALLPPDAQIGDDSLIDAMIAGRYLTVFYASAIAMLLFLMGNMLFNRWFGLLAALLFMLDPYVVRRNHFNMLEPLATLMGLLMIFFYFRAAGSFDYLERRRNLFAMGGLLRAFAAIQRACPPVRAWTDYTCPLLQARCSADADIARARGLSAPCWWGLVSTPFSHSGQH
jgi:hypothetical protein